tara:strand:+ start:411 stop:797 length:387 start_codon:yes stop_codon:yes gene_type:complete
MDYIYNFIDEDGGDNWDCCINDDKEAAELMEDMDYVSFTREDVNEADCVVGWMYYNDMEDYTEACEYLFNTWEQLDNYWENNNSHGHFSCDRIDTYKDGKLVSTEMQDERISCMNGWGLEPNPGDNLS